MNNEITDQQELLSAFVDEETSEFEVHRLCSELLNDDRELARLGRYHVIRDALRGNLPLRIDANFVVGVHAAIEREPLVAVVRDASRWRPRVLNPALRDPGRLNPKIGFGLAASVVVCAVLGFQSFNRSSSPEVPVTNVARINPSPVGFSVTSPTNSSNWQSLRQTSAKAPAADAAPRVDAPGVSLASNPDVAARLNSYLVNHSEYAPSRGMMPYARVVLGYEGNQ
ncbi:MAG: sigma-E factor negative regulatory protein [Gammaproteobacteria bacterium]